MTTRPLDQWVDESCPRLRENIRCTLGVYLDHHENLPNLLRQILLCVREHFGVYSESKPTEIRNESY